MFYYYKNLKYISNIIILVNNSKKIYNGVFDCVNKMYAKNGISGFYKGFRLNFIKAIPEVAIKFSTYDLIKFYLQN